MKTNQEITLIDGTFSASDAREILISLYNHKLHFHEMRNFSSMERFGIEDQISIKRIPELKKNLSILKELLKDAELNKEYLVIKSTVEVSLEKVGEKHIQE